MTAPQPTPGARVTRSAGQIGGAAIIMSLWLSFGWFGADGWNDAQVLSATSAVTFVVSALQNALNWWTARQNPPVEQGPPPAHAIQ